MPATRILALSFNAAHDLALSLKQVLESTPSLAYRTSAIPIPLLGSEFHERNLCRVIENARPELLVLCLAKSDHQHLVKVFEASRKILKAPIVIAAESNDPEDWRKLLALDPDDYITPPFRPADVLPRLWRLTAMLDVHGPVVCELKERLGLKQLIGESPALVAEIAKIPAVARCDATVLIRGETGTGKEMVARAVHFLSPRGVKPFNPLNCGAIPLELVENELFGHDAGAFTGANGPSTGLLRQTEGGTVFLDEVDSLPLQAQSKLLRFLQEKEFRPLGAQKPCMADVRVIAATNANLEETVKSGRLRRDLYYRLNVINLVLPPLRERKSDIPALALHFVTKYGVAFDARVRDLTPAALQKLLLYDWPGNIRELENVIERSIVFSRQSTLRSEDIDLPSPTVETDESFQALKSKLIARFERDYLQNILRAHEGNITKAAKAAGKNRRAFWEMMRKNQIDARPGARGKSHRMTTFGLGHFNPPC